MSVSVYLSGSIQKGGGDARPHSWTDDDRGLLLTTLAPTEVCLLNPASRTDDVRDPWAMFGRDILQILCSDAVIVDARDRRGVGVGAEMSFAKLTQTPVISIAPRPSHYYRQDFEFMGQRVDTWLHPFVGGLSDAIVESVEAAGVWLRDHILNPAPSASALVRDIDCYQEGMRHYIRTQLDHDDDMQRFLEAHPHARGRIESVAASEGKEWLHKGGHDER